MEIDVTPHPSLLNKIGHASFSIWQSISELIANSLDAIAEGKKAEIYIEADINHIAIKDNGVGMTRSVLEKAVRMAWPMQELRPYGSKAKSVFGLGMKTACASLGHIWSVTTLPENSDKGFKVTFDLQKFANQNNTKWTTELDEIAPSLVGLPENFSSGTVISIQRLKVRPIVDDKFKNEITRSYLPHIKTGDKFYVNGELLEEKPLELIDGTRIDVDLEVEGVRILGWGALMKKGSTVGEYGFHWYRKGQLIEKFDKSITGSHPEVRQIIGELHADNMPVNFTKKGFETESKEWKQSVRELEEKFKDLKKMARKTRKDRQDDPMSQRELKKNTEVMERVGEMVSKVFDADPPSDYCLPSVIERYSDENNEEEGVIGEIVPFQLNLDHT